MALSYLLITAYMFLTLIPCRHGWSVSGSKGRFASCVPATSSVNVSHAHIPAHNNAPPKTSSSSARVSPPYTGGNFIYEIDDSGTPALHGHVYYVDNPARTVSVLEPGGSAGGCHNKIRDTVLGSTQDQHCLLAINGGMFNTDTDECLGSIVSEGRVVQDSAGMLNAQFGITRNDELFFGYVGADTDLAAEFKQLVGGVIYLVKNGTNFVADALEVECADTQETGTLERFVHVQSARMAVGADKDGRLILIHVDGKTGKRGINLVQFADMLIEFGAIEAINLDGGGSSTFVERDVLISGPTDKCGKVAEGLTYRCARPVTTVVCVRADPDDRGYNAAPGYQTFQPLILCLGLACASLGLGRY